jgi:hypothetical protein
VTEGFRLIVKLSIVCVVGCSYALRISSALPSIALTPAVQRISEAEEESFRSFESDSGEHPLCCQENEPSDAKTGTHCKKESLMTLTFTRSGGFAGPATTVKGEVQFKDKVAKVLSDAGYQRDLNEKEASMLIATAKEIPQMKEEQGVANSPDQYQYDIQVTWDDGRSQSVTLHGDSAGTHSLLDWVRRECDLIWGHRTHQ